MDYEKLYNNIINNAIKQVRSKSKTAYFEAHHIFPKCLGGTDEKENIVLLTAKEHFICHHLLTKIYQHDKLHFAFWSMCNQLSGDVTRGYKVTASVFEKAKIKFAISNSKLHTGKKISDEHKQLLSDSWKDNNPHKAGKDSHLYGTTRPDTIKKKISETKKSSPEKNAAFKGYYVTPVGKFASSEQAAVEVCLFVENVRRRCSQSSTIINNRHIANNKDLSINDIGKTFKELGWDFLPVPA